MKLFRRRNKTKMDFTNMTKEELKNFKSFEIYFKQNNEIQNEKMFFQEHIIYPTYDNFLNGHFTFIVSPPKIGFAKQTFNKILSGPQDLEELDVEKINEIKNKITKNSTYSCIDTSKKSEQNIIDKISNKELLVAQFMSNAAGIKKMINIIYKIKQNNLMFKFNIIVNNINCFIKIAKELKLDMMNKQLIQKHSDEGYKCFTLHAKIN